MTKLSNDYDVLVIGAGVSGLAIANLLQHSGRSVALLEQHYSVGGCASYFYHKGFRFDVGATTLSGLLAPYGPIYLLQHALKTEFSGLRKLDCPMIWVDGAKRLYRYSDPIKWYAQIEDCPQFCKWWSSIEVLAKRLWPLVADLPLWHWRNSKALAAFLVKNIFAADLGTSLLKSVHASLPNDIRENDFFRCFIDEQLLIASQADSMNTSLAVGSLALTYPNDMYYMQGGVAQLSIDLLSLFKERGGKFYPRHKVKNIQKKQDGKWRVDGSRQMFCSEKVITTIPVWDIHAIQNQPQSGYESLKQESWGAFVCYLAVRVGSIDPESNYYHIRWHQQPEWCHSRAVFVSISDSEDRRKSPSGYVSINISSHVKVEDFFVSESSYISLKNQALNDCITLLKTIFPRVEIVYASAATPYTFERYTQRSQGRVGGLPHALGRPPVCFPTSLSQQAGLFHLGDTTFPGQGIMGVVSGSLKLFDYMG